MNRIVDEQYFDLIIDNTLVSTFQDQEEAYIYNINDRLSLLLASESQFDMCALENYSYDAFPTIYTLTAEISTNSNIDKVQSNPNLALFGQGVLVAVIDTGIDYQHKAFQYSDGTTRIFSIWDQTINENNTPPSGYFYGSEYNRDQINTALENANPITIVPSFDEIGHGTMIAGIIGGSPDRTNNFSGVVPQSEFVIVKLKPAKKMNKQIFSIPIDKLCYEETDLIAGLHPLGKSLQIYSPKFVNTEN